MSQEDFLREGLMLYAQGKITKQRLIEGLQFLYTSRGTSWELQKQAKLILDAVNGQSYNNTLDAQMFTFNPGRYAKKYDDYFPDTAYKNIEANSDHQGDTMQGVDYIKSTNYGRSFTHMRRMLHKLWDMTEALPDQRFDIDGQFKLNSNDLASHIISNYTGQQINDAHYKARTEYKGRGRPQGARNRNKILEGANKSQDPMLADMPDTLEIEDIIIENKPQTGEQLDSSKFVTWVDFSNRVVPIETAAKKHEINFLRIQDWGQTIDAKIEALERAAPTIIEIKPAPELPKIEMGIQHRNFEKLLRMVQARLPSGYPVIPWVYGPAGTGKTTASENVAKALQLPFYTMGTTLAKFEILGFVNTTGYQTTPFRMAYEHGGVFCGDEMDSWAKEATVAINGALANGSCNFADKMVPRHKDFIFIACANTVGAGATMDYVGRNKQDGATLDRFQNLAWPLDEALEDNLCANKDWLKYVRHVRARANSSGINPKPMITPRASMAGAALLNVGLEWQDVIEMCLRKGLSDAQWSQIK